MPIITMPKLSDTMTEGTIAHWKKKVGDKIETGDVLADIETDKATMEMEAFDDGVLQEIFVPDGGKAAVGDKIALILAEGETVETPAANTKAKPTKAKKETEKAKPASKDAPQAASASGRIKASPLARKIAAERGVDLGTISGSGPGGRIVAADVPQSGATSKAPVAPAISAKAGPGDKALPLSGMRRTIADRLVASKQQNPHFYLSLEVNAGPLARLRKDLNAASEAAGQPKLTVNDFVLLAVARAAAQHPYVNASWGGDAIIQHGSVNLAVAVAVEDGLITPVVREADKLSLREISAAVKDLAKRARDKKLKPEEYQGGTITVSNLGAYGIEQFYAIINPPQAAILAVGAIVKKPVVTPTDEIAVGERMTLSLSGDHRVVDGAVGAEFLATLRKFLESPAVLLL